ncbi:hypothetical protein NC653_000420 [Populus alba x Populus x berolinensis]|uniref:Uncharacterized protein n=1 Tax=Populus alba x Populus x berolinensis TaxID=444605 RepID=A0AAD6RIX6_9ROSI|nr:hypothetical protein NC653_000420 [Populus alba x Populus x berolinensis]
MKSLCSFELFSRFAHLSFLTYPSDFQCPQVSSDFPVVFHILYKIFVEKGFCLLSRVIVAQKMAFGTHATLSSRKLQSPEDFEPTEQRFVRIQNLVASLVLAL